MKNRLLLMLVMVAIVIIFAAYLNGTRTNQSPQASLVGKAVAECVGISENAVAGITPIIEFQKLELEGRKANVVRRCMSDHGYRENPAWAVFSKPIAEHNASMHKVSYDEAMEGLKRGRMITIDSITDEPAYWVAAITATTSTATTNTSLGK